MSAISVQRNVAVHTSDFVAKLVPGGDTRLAGLSDDELLTNTRRLVGQSNGLLAALLEHLTEVETRGIHRLRRCASLYTYCIYELRFSEDAAARRCAAARLAKQFPALVAAVAAGELHLTGLLMIGPHLTPENHQTVLARAKFRTKKELARLVRELNPLPDIPDRSEPQGPELARNPKAPTWEQLVKSHCPQVRELPIGEQPRDWANVDSTSARNDLPPITGPQRFQMQFCTVEAHVHLVDRAKALLARTRPGVTLGELHLDAMKLLVAALEKRKFAVTERAREDSHAARTSARPRQRGAMGEDASEGSALSRERGSMASEAVEKLVRPRRRGSAPEGASEGSVLSSERRSTAGAAVPKAEPPRQRGSMVGEAVQTSKVPRQRGSTAGEAVPKSEAPRQRGAVRDGAELGGRSRCRFSRPTGRNWDYSPLPHVAAAVRREVYLRDGARCTFVDALGRRCCRCGAAHSAPPRIPCASAPLRPLRLRASAHRRCGSWVVVKTGSLPGWGKRLGWERTEEGASWCGGGACGLEGVRAACHGGCCHP